MSFSTSSTLSINGVSVTLSVQVANASLSKLAGESPTAFPDEELEGLFSHCVLGMPQALLQAHEAISRSLLIGSFEILQDEINILAKPTQEDAV